MIMEVESIFEFIKNGMNIKQTKEIAGLPVTRIETIASAKIDLSRVGYAGVLESDATDFLLEDGDILFSHINSVSHIGKCAIYQQKYGKLVHGMNLLCFRPNQQKIYPKYALYLLRSNDFKKQLSKSIKKAVNQASVSITDIKKIKLNVPPLAEQKRIAEILDKADAIRRKREQTIAKLDQLAQSIFVEMFGDVILNDRRWLLQKWGSVLKIINGKNQKNVLSTDGSYPIFGSGGNEMGRANNYLCEENTIIIGRKGNINKPILVKEKFWNVDTAFGLKADEKNLSFCYLYWFCVCFDFEKLNKTVTIPSLTKNDLLNIEIPIPPISLQEQFANRIKKLEQLKADNVSALAKHKQLFASLQHQAFTGQLSL